MRQEQQNLMPCARGANLIDCEIDTTGTRGHPRSGYRGSWVRQANYLQIQQIAWVGWPGRIHRLIQDGTDRVDYRRCRVYSDADCQASLAIGIDPQ